MKYYQVRWRDRNDSSYYGTSPEIFVSSEEANRCADWHNSHPEPFCSIQAWVEVIDASRTTETFVPPMTEEEYSAMIEEAYSPHCEAEDYCEDIYDYGYYGSDSDAALHDGLYSDIYLCLDGTSEDSPREIDFIIPEAEDLAVGLGSLEIPNIDRIFARSGQATVCYHIAGEDNIHTGKPFWHYLDELSVNDMRKLLEYLEGPDSGN